MFTVLKNILAMRDQPPEMGRFRGRFMEKPSLTIVPFLSAGGQWTELHGACTRVMGKSAGFSPGDYVFRVHGLVFKCC